MSAGAMERREEFFLTASITVRGGREASIPSRTRLGDAEEEAGEEGVQDPKPMNEREGKFSWASQSEVAGENWAKKSPEGRRFRSSREPPVAATQDSTATRKE